MDLAILAFNLLPASPLDRGQMLRSLVWYPLGRARSLMLAHSVDCGSDHPIAAW